MGAAWPRKAAGKTASDPDISRRRRFSSREEYGGGRIKRVAKYLSAIYPASQEFKKRWNSLDGCDSLGRIAQSRAGSQRRAPEMERGGANPKPLEWGRALRDSAGKGGPSPGRLLHEKTGHAVDGMDDPPAFFPPLASIWAARELMACGMRFPSLSLWSGAAVARANPFCPRKPRGFVVASSSGRPLAHKKTRHIVNGVDEPLSCFDALDKKIGRSFIDGPQDQLSVLPAVGNPEQFGYWIYPARH